MLLTPALKKTKDLELSKNTKLLQDLIRRSPPAHRDAAKEAVHKIEGMRKALPKESTEAAVQQHIEYWAQLSQLEARIDSFAALDVTFTWYDSWAPPKVPISPSPVKSAACGLESAAVLFNAATLSLQVGERYYKLRTMENNYKTAAKSFVQAAGLYQSAYERVRGMQNLVSVDLSSTCLEALKTLALAHAQRCWYESAAAQSQLLAAQRLAAATADYYEAALELVSTSSGEAGMKH